MTKSALAYLYNLGTLKTLRSFPASHTVSYAGQPESHGQRHATRFLVAVKVAASAGRIGLPA
jgi:hypothetical protein